jgi:hypothetical protein
LSGAAAAGATAFDLSGIPVRLEGLSDALAARWSAEWAPFVAPAADSPFLRFDVRYDDREPPETGWDPKGMSFRLDGGHAVYALAEGEAVVDATGSSRVTLGRGLGEREWYAAANLMRASLAWCLPRRPGALIHAAGLVVGERAFLLVGSEGSGKSTWARLGESAGERVVSDDLVLVDGAGSRLELVDAPFHSTHRVEHRPGRWPLAGILFPVHGTTPARRPAPALIARARVAANLPFVSDVLGADQRLERLLDRILAEVPLDELIFGLEASFIDLLRSGA